MALLKVKVPVARLAALMDALRPEPNEFQVASYSFQTINGIPDYREKKTIQLVNILPGDRKFDGEYIEVNLELLVKYPYTEDDREVVRDVHREVIDRLFDLLGIFPREKKAKLLQETIDLVRITIHNATAMIGTIVENEVGREDLRRDLLRQVETIYKAETDFLKSIG